MLMLTAKRTYRQSCHGKKLLFCSPLTCIAIVSVALQLTAGQTTSSMDSNRMMKNEAETSTGLDLHRPRQVKELELKIIHNENLTFSMDQRSKVKVNFTLYCSHPSVAYSLTMYTENGYVVAVEDFEMFNISCAGVFPHGLSENGLSPNAEPEGFGSSDLHEGANPKHDSAPLGVGSVPVAQGSFNVTLHADLIGRTWLHIFGQRYSDPEAVIPNFIRLPWNDTDVVNSEPSISFSANFNDEELSTTVPDAEFSYGIASHGDRVPKMKAELEKHLLTVIRIRRPVDYAFRIVLYIFVMIATVGMGCKTEMSVVKEVVKKPVAPAIGFFCQYLFMPLIAFFVAKVFVVGDPAVSLGIFTCGICPGGGPSNLFSYLLDGDVSLSVTMTAISSVAAIAMIPLWLFTLGTQFEDDNISLQVPFGRIFMTLAIIIVPLFIGLAIKRWLPKVAKCILKVLKPFTLLIIVFLLTFGTYANLYVFRLFSPRTLLAGCLLPYIGYILGAVISSILRQPCYRVKTIAIETGIQNTSIAYLLLIFSLPDPDGDIAAVGPMASAIMTPQPLFLLVLAYLFYKKCVKKKEGEGKDGEKREGEEGVALREGEGLEEKNGNVQKSESGIKV